MKYVLTRSGCMCATNFYTKNGAIRLRLPKELGFGDTVAEWIHRVLNITPCAACQRRRSFLNRLFPYFSKSRPEWRAWNAFLLSGATKLPVEWDSETDAITPLI